jgi:N,N'-diacetyllegionaminate synthase
MKPELIAELAQSFEGKIEQAKILLKAAISSGANSAKFQIVYADELATFDYQHYDLFKSLEMKDSDWIALNNLARENHIDLYADIFGDKSLNLAEKMELKAVKVHGTDISNIEFLKKISKSKIPKVFLGIGGAFKNEIYKAIEILGRKKINLMLGFQSYPTPNHTNQISRFFLLKELYDDVELGFADHSNPDDNLTKIIPSMALACGASVIEKHLTLGKSMRMEDYESALNPDEFKEFSSSLRKSYRALGKFEDKKDFGMTNSELNYRKMVRRDVVASENIKKGEIIKPSHLSLKRSSNKKAIKKLEIIFGKKALKNIKKNHPLILKDIE